MFIIGHDAKYSNANFVQNEIRIAVTKFNEMDVLYVAS